MSDTFKYLDNKEGKAQDFLKGKMQTVANASEGVVPGGGAYEKYGKMPGTESETSTAYSGPDKRDDMFAADTDWGRNYRAGIYGGGDYNAEELATRYGLDNSKEAEAKGGEENIYGTRADGSSVFLGRMNMDLASNSELIKAHSKQRHQDEGDHLAEKGDLDSMGDVTGALLASWKDAGATVAATAPEPEKERTPIKHSLEIKEAKERVRSYEDSVLSGELSNDIYGKSNDIANDNYMDNYQLNLNKGQVGTGSADSGEEASAVATDSFLDSKKADVKKEYQFKPKTNSGGYSS